MSGLAGGLGGGDGNQRKWMVEDGDENIIRVVNCLILKHKHH